MNILRDLDKLTSPPMTKQLDLFTIEHLGRALLFHAAVENYNFGYGKDHQLQAYSGGRALRAEFLRTDQEIEPDPESFNYALHDRLTITLGRGSLIIAHDFRYPSMKGFVDTHKAILRRHGTSTIEMYESRPGGSFLDSRLLGIHVLEKDTAKTFRADIEEQVDLFEVNLSSTNLVIPSELI